MLFLNVALLGGLAAVSIPIIIHLLNRRSAKVIDWGAMRFLLDSVLTRKRRIQLEEALLMAARCLLVALIALCVARPFVPPASRIPWVIVLPLFLLGVALAAVTAVMWPEKRLRWKLAGLTALLFLLCGAAIAAERWLNLKKFGTAGRRDIALIVDGSMSMVLPSGAGTNFELAVREAEKIVTDAGSGSAFSLILGAPVPQAVVGQPVVNRAQVREALTALKPVRGKMAAFDSIALAAVTLAQGTNPRKEIIVLTDGQDVGWEIDKPARWEALKAGFATVGAQPSLIIRQFPLPATLRNVAIAGVRFSRPVIGTDRPVGIEVSITNTGTEAVTPAALDLTIGDQKLTDSSIGQLAPGLSATVRFQHHFTEPGAFVTTAVVQADDDIPPDNTWPTVSEVQETIRVLIVEGQPAADFLARAGSFTALALAPGSLLSSTVRTDDTPPAAKDLVDPEVIPLTQLATLDGFGGHDVVILCDVPALPPSSARQLADFVAAGGGLLVAPGPHAKPDFYNDWRTTGGQPVMPLRLVGQAVAAAGAEIKPALDTFSHEALRLVADARQSDLGLLHFTRYWKMSDAPAGDSTVYVGGRLANGDVFLSSRRLGHGTVVATGASLDAHGSNLATRHAFVPLVHEIVHHLATPGGQRLNQPPAYTVNVPIARTRAANGLRAEFFDTARPEEPLLSRIDPKIDVNWPDAPAPGVPPDQFRVRWTGSVVPRFSEEYTFIAEADDSIAVFVNDEQLIGNRRRKDRIDLVAGQPASIRVELTEGSGQAVARLFWQSRSQRREIIPTSCLWPQTPEGREESEATIGTLAATGPDGESRNLDLVRTPAGIFARLDTGVVPGLYLAPLPEIRRAQFAGVATADSALAFTVVPDPSEGKIKPLDEAAFQFLQKYMLTMRPGTVEELIGILNGRQFGEELWKYLAAGALVLALAETALARWIAIQRRTGNETAIEFESRFEPRQAFQQTAEQLRKIA